MRLAMWLVLGSVPTALLGPHLINWLAPPGGLDRTLKLCIGFALLFAAATYALRLYINLRRMRTGQPLRRHGPGRPAAPDAAGRRPRWPARRDHQRRLRVGDHDRAADALPRPRRCELVGTDLVQAVPLVLAAADLQHRAARARLDHPRPADPRLGARHDPRQHGRAAGAPVDHPARDRRRAHDVAAWRCSTRPAGRRWVPASTRPTRGSSASSVWSCCCCCPWSGASCAARPGCRCSVRPPSRRSRTRRTARAGTARRSRSLPRPSPIVGKSAATASSTSSSAAD